MPDHLKDQPAQTQAVRLIFEYEGEEVRLVSRQPVDVTVRSFEFSRASQAGVFVDVRDQMGALLGRVPAPGALATSVEVFPEKPDETIVRVDVPKPKGAFTVVVPVLAAADRVVVVRIASMEAGAELSSGTAPTTAPSAGAVTDIATFSLQRGH